jgi:hypothetical protein
VDQGEDVVTLASRQAKRPLEVGDRVAYPGDPRDLGTVVEVHRVVTRAKSRYFSELAHMQAVILWDRGQHDSQHLSSRPDVSDFPAEPTLADFLVEPAFASWPTCTVADGRGSASWKRHRCVMPDLDEARADTFELVTVGDGKKVHRVRGRVGVLAAERDLARAQRRF